MNAMTAAERANYETILNLRNRLDGTETDINKVASKTEIEAVKRAVRSLEAAGDKYIPSIKAQLRLFGMKFN